MYRDGIYLCGLNGVWRGVAVGGHHVYDQASQDTWPGLLTLLAGTWCQCGGVLDSFKECGVLGGVEECVKMCLGVLLFSLQLMANCGVYECGGVWRGQK